MELKDLKGMHKLSGVDYENGPDGEKVKFCLDGVTYIAEEDPCDGYRSLMKDLEVSETPCKNTFPDEDVFCEHDEGEHGDDDILWIKSVQSTEEILVIGTREYSDYYPLFVMHYCPENLSCNKNNKKLDQNLIRKLYDIRIVINAGNNKKGCYLCGETCKDLVTQIDQIMIALTEPCHAVILGG